MAGLWSVGFLSSLLVDNWRKWHFSHPTACNEAMKWHQKNKKDSYVPLSRNECMDGGMLLENEPRKSPKWKPAEIPEGPRIVSVCVIIWAPRSSRLPESVTKWPRWLLPNTSSHSTRMGAKLVLIESVIHRCSPPSEGGKQTRAVSHIFCRCFDEGAVFFWVTRRNKQDHRWINGWILLPSKSETQSESTLQSSQMQDRTQGWPPVLQTSISTVTPGNMWKNQDVE